MGGHDDLSSIQLPTTNTRSRTDCSAPNVDGTLDSRAGGTTASRALSELPCSDDGSGNNVFDINDVSRTSIASEVLPIN